MSQLQALGLTLLLELPVVLLLARLLGWPVAWKRLLLLASAASLLTHPFAWEGLRWLRAWTPDFWPRAVVVEVAIALVEGVLYAKLGPLGWRRGLLLGLGVNAWSFGLGLVLARLWW